jgi:hypothetical protein
MTGSAVNGKPHCLPGIVSNWGIIQQIYLILDSQFFFQFFRASFFFEVSSLILACLKSSFKGRQKGSYGDLMVWNVPCGEMLGSIGDYIVGPCKKSPVLGGDIV